VANCIVHNCHNQVQFYVKEIDGIKHLSAQLYCRSSDYFLGLPFNIFSYVVLIYILAKKCDMVPDELIITLGDSHIYQNHLEQVKEMLQYDNLRSLPVLKINDSVKDKKYEEITIDDFIVSGYFPGKTIKAPMAI
jgi:thymidylate synthase